MRWSFGRRRCGPVPGVGEVDARCRGGPRDRAGVAAALGVAGRRRRGPPAGLDERRAGGGCASSGVRTRGCGGARDSRRRPRLSSPGRPIDRETFRLIEAERARHTVSRLCKALGVTRSGFYAWSSRSPSARELRDRQLLELIGRIHKDSRGTYGVPRVHAELLHEHGVRIARKRVARLMRRLGIKGVSRRGKRPVTTRPKQPAPAVDDLVRRRFRAPEPNRLWVADITYVLTCGGVPVLGGGDRRVQRRCVGWSMRTDLKADLVLDALGWRSPAPASARADSPFRPRLAGRIQVVVATLDEGGLRWAGRRGGRQSGRDGR